MSGGLRDLDALAAQYPEFRRLLAAANKAAAKGGPAYTEAHAAVVVWNPPVVQTELTDREVHAAFCDGTGCRRALPYAQWCTKCL
jgi:hypothetical protein